MSIITKFLSVMLLFIAGCGEVDIHGKMYIITGAQQTIPLADTEIQLFDESKVIEPLKRFEAERTEFNEKFQSILPLLIEGANKKLELIQAQVPLSTIDSKIETNRYIIANSGPELPHETREKLSDELEQDKILRQSLASNVENLSNEFSKIKALTDDLSEKQKYYNNPITYIKFLEANAQGIKARTDSNGNYASRLPKPGKYLVVANNQRNIIDKTEVYAWLFWVNLEKSNKTQIDITNRNLQSTNCETCLYFNPIKAIPK